MTIELTDNFEKLLELEEPTSLRNLADLFGYPFKARALEDRAPETCDGAPSGEKKFDIVEVVGECPDHPRNLKLSFHPYVQTNIKDSWSCCWDGWQKRWELVIKNGDPCAQCGGEDYYYIPRLGGGCSVVCKSCDYYNFIPPTEDEAEMWKGK